MAVLGSGLSQREVLVAIPDLRANETTALIELNRRNPRCGCLESDLGQTLLGSCTQKPFEHQRPNTLSPAVMCN